MERCISKYVFMVLAVVLSCTIMASCDKKKDIVSPSDNKNLEQDSGQTKQSDEKLGGNSGENPGEDGGAVTESINAEDNVEADVPKEPRPYIVRVKVLKKNVKIPIEIKSSSRRLDNDAPDLPDDVSINYSIDINADGSIEYAELTGDFELPIKKPGTYRIAFNGVIPRLHVVDLFEEGDSPHLLKDAYLVAVEQWGTVQWKSMKEMFDSNSQLNEFPKDEIPDLRAVTNMKGLFAGATAFNQPLDNWDVSKVTNMNSMFHYAESFNQPIASWRVSKVTDMENMFYGAKSFNQRIDKWDVSKVANMGGMFYDAESFNQPLENWNVSNVTNMNSMFLKAKVFNQPLENWNVSRVVSMRSMFTNAKSFNQPLEKWDVSKVTNMGNMFMDAESFNQPLNSWNITNVTDMSWMFTRAKSYNQSLQKWDVTGKITDEMLLNAKVSKENYPKGLR